MRLTEGNMALINRELQKIQDLQETVGVLENTVDKLNVQVAKNTANTEKSYTNTIAFSWDGPTTKISWTDGFIREKSGTIYTVPAGNRTGYSANTTYWTAWNPVHQSMIINTSLAILRGVKKNIILGSVYTGTLIETGDLGGGGVEGGGEGGGGVWSRYKEFP